MSSNGDRGDARSIKNLRLSGMSLSWSVLLKLERSCLRYLEVSSSCLHSLSYPGYQWFFSRVRRGASSAWPTRLWPKAEDTSGPLFETGNRLEKPLAPWVSLSEKERKPIFGSRGVCLFAP